MKKRTFAGGIATVWAMGLGLLLLTLVSAPAAAISCSTKTYVNSGGAAGNFTTITAGLAALPTTLAGSACVEIQNSATYTEQVTVQNFINNGSSITILALSTATVTVSPPANSTAAFVVANSSVNIFGINVVPTNAMTYGVAISSTFVSMSSVNVQDSGGNISAAGLAVTSGWTTINYASVTMGGANAAGFLILGNASNVSYSTAVINAAGSYALWIGSSSSIFTQCYLDNSGGTAAYLAPGVAFNQIIRSTFTAGAGGHGLYLNSGTSNTISQSVFNGAAGPAGGHGVYINAGSSNTISLSVMTGGTGAYANPAQAGGNGLYITSSSSNTFTQDVMTGGTGGETSNVNVNAASGGHGASLQGNCHGNTFSQSTLNGGTGGIGTVVSGTALGGNGGNGLYLGGGFSNVVTQSTMTGGTGGDSKAGVSAPGNGGNGLFASGSSSNTVVNDIAIGGPPGATGTPAGDGGPGIQLQAGSNYNLISKSTVTGNGTTLYGLYVGASSSNTISGDYVQGATAAYVSNSVGTAIGGSILVAVSAGGNALQMGGGSVNLTLSSSSLSALSSGTGLLLASGNGGQMIFSTNTITGAQYGMLIATKAAGASISIASMTFANLSAGATAMQFTGGTFVSTFTMVSFDASAAVNVNALALSSGSSITMSAWSGAQGGPTYDIDPNNYVHWLSTTVPTYSYCAATYYVGSGQTYATISAALAAMPASLPTGESCVAIEDAATYNEQVMVANFTMSGSSIAIFVDPAVVGIPSINPPVGSTAAFVIANASVSVSGINVKPTNAITYGIAISSAYVSISSVNVKDAGGNISLAGVEASSWTSISYTSVTVGGASAAAYWLNGSTMTSISFSTGAANDSTAARGVLWFNNASSNTITKSFFTNLGHTGVYMDATSNFNAIAQSTMTSTGVGEALYLNGASYNSFTQSYMADLGGMAVYLPINSYANTISFSTMASNAASVPALELGGIGGSSSNTITQCLITNPSGVAAYVFPNSNGNAITQSTILGSATAYWALEVFGASSNTFTNDTIQGSTAAYVYGSTGTVISGSALVATSSGSALSVGGSVNLTLTNSTLTSGSAGTGIGLSSGGANSGTLYFSTDTITGGRYGLFVATQSAGASLSVAYMTFASLSAGATAMQFTGGTVVSTFSNVSFDGSVRVNVNAAALAGGSSITMSQYSGAHGGPAYDIDPSSYVYWVSSTSLTNYPGCVATNYVGSGQTYATISSALAALPSSLAAGESCVVIEDGATYNEQVTVANFTMNASSIAIFADPGSGLTPFVNPPVSSTAAFVILNSSVSVTGINIVPTHAITYGVDISSTYVSIVHVNVVDPGGKISLAGVLTSSWTSVSYTSVTVGGANATGFWLNGNTMTSVSYSSAAATNAAVGNFALWMNSATSNTITQSYFYDSSNDAAAVDVNSFGNVISFSVMKSSGVAAAFYLAGSSNIITQSFISNPMGIGVYFLTTAYGNTVSMSTITSNISGNYALEISAASSNTISQCSISNPLGTAVYLFSAANSNTIVQSTINGTFWFANSSNNTLTQSYVNNPASLVVYLSASNNNTISLSTITGGGSSPYNSALYLSSSSSNTITQSYINNPSGNAAFIQSSNYDAINQSTMSSNAAGDSALYLTLGVSDTFNGDSIKGSTAVYVYDSTGTVITSSVLVGTCAVQIGGSVNTSLVNSLLTGVGPTGTGINLSSTTNTGQLIFTSNTITGAAYGLYVSTLSGGATLSISSMTFANLAAGSTAMQFTGETVVATFTAMSFDGSVGANINASALSGGSSITMASYAGARAGPNFDNDPSSYVHWLSSNYPGCAVANLVGIGQTYATISSALNALPGSLPAGESCVVIEDGATYNEQVTVANFTMNASSIAIFADPASGLTPIVDPPAGTAAFVIANASVSVTGINIDPTHAISYGVLISSAYVQLSHVNVQDIGGGISVAGIVTSNWTTVSFTSVTEGGNSVVAASVNGNSSTISHSSMTSNSANSLSYTVIVTGSSNTFAQSYIFKSNQAGYGMYMSGANGNTISQSVIISSSNAAGLYLLGSSSNTITQSFIGNNSYGLYLDAGSNGNVISLSTLATNSGAFFMNGASSNTVTQCYMTSPGYTAAQMNTNANYNTISQSTMTGSTYISGGSNNTITQSDMLGGMNVAGNNNTISQSAMPYLQLVGASYNTVTQSYIYNPLGTALFMNAFSSFNAISQSTMASNVSANSWGLFMTGSSNTFTGDYIQGSTAAYVTGSTGTVITASSLFGTSDIQIAGSINITLSGSVLTAGSTGAGITLIASSVSNSGNSGQLVFTSNTITGARYGMLISTITPGASLNVSSMTFENLASGATAMQFTGGTFVSTFTAVNFDASVGANVNASALSGGSNITMLAYAGAHSGAAYDNDPNHYVHWANAPLVAILSPVPQAMDRESPATLATLSGTAFDPVAGNVVAVQLRVRNENPLVYWDPANNTFDLGAALSETAWFNAVTSNNYLSWTSTTSNITSDFVGFDGSTFTVMARAQNGGGAYSVPYASNTFVYDSLPPQTGVTSPANGSNVVALNVSGTAVDYPLANPGTVVSVQVRLQRLSDGDFWDGAAWNSSVVSMGAGQGVAVYPSSWSVAGANLPSGANLQLNASYYVTTSGVDGSGNVEAFGSPRGSTFTYISMCSVSTTVVAGVNSIQGAVNAAGGSLSGNLCVFVNGGTYNEQVNVQNIATNGFQILIASGTGGQAVINPPVSSTAAFVIANSSVVLSGINVAPTNLITYGVLVSSTYVSINNVNVQDAVGRISAAGVALSNWTTVSQTSVTVGGTAAAGFWLPGATQAAISASSAAAGGASGYALLLNGGASNNTITQSVLVNLKGYSTFLDIGSNSNAIGQSAMISSSTAYALWLNSVSSNTVTQSSIVNFIGYALGLNTNAGYNVVSQSTVTAKAGGYYAVYLNAASFNTFTQNYLFNQSGTGVYFNAGSNGNTISQSTVASAIAGYYGLIIQSASSNTITQSLLSNPPGTGVYLLNDSYDAISFSSISVNNAAFNAFLMSGASNDQISHSTIGNPAGAGADILNSNSNAISQSVINTACFGCVALDFQGASLNTVAQSFIRSPLGDAAILDAASAGNVINQSTMTSSAAGYQTVVVYGSSNSFSGDYVQGSTAVYVSGSTNTLIGGSVLVATNTTGSAVELDNGSVGLSLSSSTLSAAYAGLTVAAGGAGQLVLSTDTITGARFGMILPPLPNAVLAVTSITFANLAAGSTGMQLTAGIMVATFTTVSWDGSVGTDVNASALSPGSAITMTAPGGAHAGPAFADDPSHYVNWSNFIYPGCAVTANVGVQQQPYATISAGLNSLPGTLPGPACVVIRDGATYNEQVVVRNFVTNGSSITIFADPASGLTPVVSPPAGSTAAFVIANTSVAVTGINVVPTFAITYGVLVSSPSVRIVGVNVQDAAGNISVAGLAASSGTTVSGSSVTAGGANAAGFLIAGAGTNLSFSSAAANGANGAALYLKAANANTITQSSFTASSGYGAYFNPASNANTISFSALSGGAAGLFLTGASSNTIAQNFVFGGLTISTASNGNAVSFSTVTSALMGGSALNLTAAFSNTFTQSFFADVAGYGAYLSGAGLNTVSQSTITANNGNYFSLFLAGSSSNTITQSVVVNPSGHAVEFSTVSNSNSIGQSVVTAAGTGYALFLAGVSSNAVVNSQLSSARYTVYVASGSSFNAITNSTVTSSGSDAPTPCDTALTFDVSSWNTVTGSVVSETGGGTALNLNAGAFRNTISLSSLSSTIQACSAVGVYGSSNTVTGSVLSDPAGGATLSLMGHNNNLINSAVSANGGSGSAVNFTGAVGDLIAHSAISNPAGVAVLGGAAFANTITGSTITSNSSSQAFWLTNVSSFNLITQSLIQNPGGTAAQLDGQSGFNTISQSTVTSGGAGNYGVYVYQNSSDILTNDYILGSTAVYVSASTGTAIGGTILYAGNAGGNALQLDGAAGLNLFNSSLNAFSAGAGLALTGGNNGPIVIATDVITGAGYGLFVATQAAGASLSIVGLNFNGLAAGATAMNLIGGTVVATFTSVNFDASVGANVNASALSAGSSISMQAATGAHAGPAFDDDPNQFVHWLSSNVAYPGCAVTEDVNQTGGPFTNIQSAVNALPSSLTGPSCVVIRDGATYTEQVTVQNINVNGNPLSIFADPGSGVTPVVSPPANSTAAFVIANASTSIKGINVVASNSVPYGVWTSSAFDSVVNVFVTTSGPSGIYAAGIRIGPWTTVTNSSVTVWNAHGLWLDPTAQNDTVTNSVFQNNSSSFGAVYVNGAAASLLTSVWAGNPGGRAATIDAGASLNVLTFSTFTANHNPQSAVFLNGVSSNTIGNSMIVDPLSVGVTVNGGGNNTFSFDAVTAVGAGQSGIVIQSTSTNNTITGCFVTATGQGVVLNGGGNFVASSTVTANSSAGSALYLAGSSNTVIGSYLANQFGPAALFYQSSYNMLSLSTFTSNNNAGAYPAAVSFSGASYNSVTQSSIYNPPGDGVGNAGSIGTYVAASLIKGATAFLDAGSTGTVVALNNLRAGTGSGVWISSGDVSPSVLSNVIVVSSGDGVLLDYGSSGILNVSSNTVTGASNGVAISTQNAGAVFGFTADVFQMLTPGATALNFLGGTVVSSFTGLSFDASVAVNVDAAALSTGTSITMILPLGLHTGPVFADDPYHYVRWLSSDSFAGCAVTEGVGAGQINATIQAGVNSLPASLPAGQACVVIEDGGTYSEQVTVRNFTMNGATLSIFPDPATHLTPTVSPPAGSTAAFVIANASVTVKGFTIVPTNAMTYGVAVSSGGVTISSVGVLDPGGLIALAGMNLTGAGDSISNSMINASFGGGAGNGAVLSGPGDAITASTVSVGPGAAAVVLAGPSETASQSYFASAGFSAVIVNGANDVMTQSTAVSSGPAPTVAVFGAGGAVTQSVVTGAGAGAPGVVLGGGAGLLAGDAIGSPAGYGVFFSSNAFGNVVSRSTITVNNAGYAAVGLAGASSNTIVQSLVANPSGVAASINGGGANTISASAVNGGGAGPGLEISGSSLNVVTQSFVGGGVGVEGGSAFTTISFSTLSSVLLGRNLTATGASTTTILNSYVAGSPAVSVVGSTGTSILGSVLVAAGATGTGGSALSLTGGSVGLTVASNTIVGGATGAGVVFGASNSGTLALFADLIEGTPVGLSVAAQAPGANLALSALTFSALTPGATAINFTGGQVVSTFTAIVFNGPGLAVDVNAAALSAGSSITMSGPSGTRSGPGFAVDPGHFVHWPFSNPPLSAVTVPSLAVVSAVPVIAGTAQAFSGAGVAGVSVSVLSLTAGQYWNGSAFVASNVPIFNAAALNSSGVSTAPASWAFSGTALTAALTNGTSYQIQSQAIDSFTQVQAAVSTITFTFDVTPPVVSIQLPIAGAVYSSLPTISGTSGDKFAVAMATTTLSVQQLGGLCYNPALGTFSAACPYSFGAQGTPAAWSYSGLPWASGQQYLLAATAKDAIGNVATSSTTFSFAVSTSLAVGTPGDGQGMAVLASTGALGCQLLTATATYTAGPAGIAPGGAVAMRVPAGWTLPQGTSVGQPGYVSVLSTSGYNVSFNPATLGSANLGSNWIVYVATTSVGPGQSIQFAYEGYPPQGASAQGPQVFAFESRGAGNGQLVGLSSSPAMNVTPGAPALLSFVPSSALTIGQFQNSPPMQIQLWDSCGVPTVQPASPLSISLQGNSGGGADPLGVFSSTTGSALTSVSVPAGSGLSAPFVYETSTSGVSMEQLSASANLINGAVGVQRTVNLLVSSASINGASVDTGVKGSATTATIVENSAAGVAAYINFTLSNPSLSWEVIVSSVPGVFTYKLADYYGTGNPGRTLTWNGLNNQTSPPQFLPPGTYYVEIVAGGGSAVNTALTVVLAPAPSIYGQVTNGPGAKVVAVGPNALSGNFAVASSTGFFQIFGLQSNTAYLVQASSSVQISSTVISLSASVSGVVATTSGTNAGSLTFQVPALVEVSATLPFPAPADLTGTVSVHDAAYAHTGSGTIHFFPGATSSDNGAQAFGVNASTLTAIAMPPGTYEVDVALPALGISTSVFGVVVNNGVPVFLPIALQKLVNAYGYAVLPAPAAASTLVSVTAQNQNGSVAVGGVTVPVAASSAVYSLFGLTAGNWTVTAVAQGALPASTTVFVSGSSDIGTAAGGGLNLTLKAAGVLSGTLTVSGDTSQSNLSSTCPNGAALCAAVTASDPANYFNSTVLVVLATSTSRTSAVFSFPGVPDGLYAVSAALSGFTGAGQNVSIVSGAGAANLAMTANGSKVQVTVKLPAGVHPASDFKTVSLGCSGSQGASLGFADMTAGTTIQYFASSATVAMSGLDADLYEFQAFNSATGMYRAVSAALASNTSASLLIDMSAPTYAVGGSFSLGANLTLPNNSGQSVSVSSVAGLLANTGSLSYCLLGYASPPSISAAHLELLPAGPTGAFAGGALPSASNGCPANLISPSAALPNPYMAFVATIAANGSFSFPAVPPGVYQLRNNSQLDAAGDQIPQFSQTVVVTGTVSGLIFQAGSGANISGSVTAQAGVLLSRSMTVNLSNASGQLMASAPVVFNNSNSASYSFQQLASGNYTLALQDSSYPKAYAAAPLQVTLSGQNLSGQNLTVVPAGTIKCRVVVQEPSSSGGLQSMLIAQPNFGLLPASFQIQAAADPWFSGGLGFAGGPNASGVPVLDANGEFVIDGLLPGSYDVKFNAPSAGAGAVALVAGTVPGVVVTAGNVTDMGVVNLGGGTQLSGTVTDASNNQPAANIRVHAAPSQRGAGLAAQSVDAVTDGSGRYVLSGLDPKVRFYDVYTAFRGVETQGESLLPYQQTIAASVDLSSVSVLNVALAPAAYSVTGQVVVPAGGPALGVPSAGGYSTPGALIYFQKSGVIPVSNPIADIQFQTDYNGSFTIPSVTTGTYLLIAASQGYASLSRLVTITTASVNLGVLTMAQGATLSGTLTNPDGSNPSVNQVAQVLAVTADLSNILVGSLTTNPNTQTVSAYSIAGFKPGYNYRVMLLDGAKGVVAPPEAASVVFASTGAASINIVYRPVAPLVIAVAARTGSGFQLEFDMSQPLRNLTSGDGALASIVTPVSAAGSLSNLALSQDRTRLTGFYVPGVLESSFTFHLRGYSILVDPSSVDPINPQFPCESTVTFFTGIDGLGQTNVGNLEGGDVLVQGDKGRVTLPPGSFNVAVSSSVLITLQVAGKPLASGTETANMPAAVGGRLKSLRYGPQAYPSEIVAAAAAVPPNVNPLSAFYNIFLPLGVNSALSKPAQLTVAYSSGTDPTTLNLYWYNPTANTYVLTQDVTGAPPVIDAANQTITLNVGHFSTYVLFNSNQAVITGSTGAGALTADNFPNPFDLGSKVVTPLHAASGCSPSCTISGTMIGVSVPPNASGNGTIRIFNVAGTLVRTISLGSLQPGTFYYQNWDGTNDYGRPVASGAYIGELQIGSQKTFFRMAVIKGSGL